MFNKEFAEPGQTKHERFILTLPMLRLLSSKAQGRKYFEKHVNPVILVFIV